MQEVREHQPRGSCSDNSDLGSHRLDANRWRAKNRARCENRTRSGANLLRCYYSVRIWERMSCDCEKHRPFQVQGEQECLCYLDELWKSLIYVTGFARLLGVMAELWRACAPTTLRLSRLMR